VGAPICSATQAIVFVREHAAIFVIHRRQLEVDWSSAGVFPEAIGNELLGVGSKAANV
jgi:hypothetical protein